MHHNPRMDDKSERSHRRGFLAQLGVGSATALAGGVASGAPPAQQSRPASNQTSTRPNPIGVSTYSFWQFREGARRLTIAECIDKAAAMGFDGVEILHVQMEDESNAALQKVKRQAHSLGLALMGFSTHQGFVHSQPAGAADERPEDALPDRCRLSAGHPDDADQHGALGDHQVV